MSLFNIGRLCVKLAGRDAGRKCVVIGKVSEGKVLIDGNTRRREVSINHLEPLPETLDVGKEAAHDVVSKVFEANGLKVWNTKPKKVTGSRILKQKKVKGQSKKPKKLETKAAKVSKKKETKVVEKAEVKPVEVKEIKKEVSKEASSLADSLVEKQS